MLGSKEGPPVRLVLTFHQANAPQAEWAAGHLVPEGYAVDLETWSASRWHERIRRRQPVPAGARLILVLLSRHLAGEPDLAPVLEQLAQTGALFPIKVDAATLTHGSLDRLNYLRLFEFGANASEVLLHAVDRTVSGVRPGELPSDPVSIFISYAFEDGPAAARIEAQLRDAGHTTVRATDFLVGENWVSRLDAAISHAWLVLTLLSSSYFNSFWCYDEFFYSPAERRVLLYIEDCGLAGEWRDRVHVDLVGLDETAARAVLLATVAAELKSPSGDRHSKRPSNTWSAGPWNEDLINSLFHPQLRVDPFQVGSMASLETRRWAARRVERGDF